MSPESSQLPAIRIEGISKRYRLGARDQRADTLAGALKQAALTPWRNFQRLRGLRSFDEQDDDTILWALRDVSFEVRPGEVVGLIGRNGAGKSTLLKILSRITPPTSGRIEIRGRIASLLEVGTGFHPDLTGRDNIFLNGSLLGLKRREIQAQFDEIVDFSGISRFIDTPVKRYSSGMYVRLAFAVAAHLRPEILLVDEVLAVGDADFQKKCLGKMKDISGEGRSVLFVSHNMAAVKSLCRRSILLRHGGLVADGPTHSVVQGYLDADFRQTLARTWEAPTSGDTGVPYVSEARIVAGEGSAGKLVVGRSFSLEICVNSERQVQANVSPHFLGAAGEVLFAVPSPVETLAPGNNWFRCRIPDHFFNDGIYTLQIMLVRDSKAIQVINDALVFEVLDAARDGSWFGKWPGVVRPRFDWVHESHSNRSETGSH